MNEGKPVDQSDSDVRHWLDAEVDYFCGQYVTTEGLPRVAEDDGSELGVALVDVEPFNKALLELVFVADARAQCDVDETALLDKRLWVAQARAGLKRIHSGMERSRPFSVESSAADQIVSYDDMSELRTLPAGMAIEHCRGLLYARLVLSKEVDFVGSN